MEDRRVNMCELQFSRVDSRHVVSIKEVVDAERCVETAIAIGVTNTSVWLCACQTHSRASPMLPRSLSELLLFWLYIGARSFVKV
jgi:hypothetical protein